jgi:carnitine-CoA ligase
MPDTLTTLSNLSRSLGRQAAASLVRVTQGVRVTEAPAGLIGLFEGRRAAKPDERLLRDAGRWWSAAEIGARSDAYAAILAEAGIRRGDHVAFLLDNSADFVAAFFGVARLGAVAVTLNTQLRADSLRYILPHSDAKVLLLEPELEELAVDLAPDCPLLQARMTAGPELDHALAACEGLEPPPLQMRDRAETAAILYTSGTTGLPKGVLLTDHGYVRASSNFVAAMRLGPEDVLHTCLPLFHINAQQLSLCGAVSCGATLVLAKRFSASGFWDTIGALGVTSFNLIGAMLAILHAQPPSEREHAHHVRVACVAPVPGSLLEECERRYGLMLLDGYGLTETTPGITFNPYGRARPGSCGKASPYVQLRIVGPGGEALAPGEKGEILIRTTEPDVMMTGYYKDPDASASALAGGWFHSGDRGWLDEDGYFYFVDRIKDVIRRRGENISPIEIEHAVLKHPAVLEAAAVGVPSELAGGEDDVAVFLIPRPGETVDPAEVVAICEQRIAPFMVPRYVGIATDFPRTETQRVQKFALRERGVAGCFDRECERKEERG